MKHLFNFFLKDQKITINPSLNPSELSIKFNRWITDSGNRRNKRIVNEANQFMIKKWISRLSLKEPHTI